MLTVNSPEQDEEYFLFAGLTRNGKALDDEAVKRLFSLDGKVLGEAPQPAETGITGILDQKEKAALDRVSRRNVDYFEKEAGKLDAWAEDLKLGPEREIKDIDKQIKETRRFSLAALTLEEKLRCQKEIKPSKPPGPPSENPFLMPRTTQGRKPATAAGTSWLRRLK
jgi:adenine-specific DNA-methyltransferase